MNNSDYVLARAKVKFLDFLADENPGRAHDVIIDACFVMKSTVFIEWVCKNHIYEYINQVSEFKPKSHTNPKRDLPILVYNDIDAFYSSIDYYDEDEDRVRSQAQKNYAALFGICCLNNYRGYLKSSYLNFEDDFIESLLHKTFLYFLGLEEYGKYYGIYSHDGGSSRYSLGVETSATKYDHRLGPRLRKFQLALKSNIFDKFVNTSDPGTMEFFDRFMKEIDVVGPNRRVMLTVLIFKNPSMLASKKLTEIYEYVLAYTPIKNWLVPRLKPRTIESFRNPVSSLIGAFSDLSFIFQKNNKRKHDADTEEEPDRKFSRHTDEN